MERAAREELWDELHTLVRARGGQVVSIQNKFPITMLCSEHSTLPTEIRLYTRYKSKGGAGRYPATISFSVEKVGQRAVINPIGHVHVEAGRHSSSPPARVTHHAHIEQLTEYEIDMRRTSIGGNL